MMIPNDRIKTVVALAVFRSDDQEFSEHYLWEEMAREITAKLKEFGKLERRTINGAEYLSSHIDIIVPNLKLIRGIQSGSRR